MIPLSKPYIKEEEINSVIEVLKSGRLSLGNKLTEFQDILSNYIGTKYAVAVNSGTSALHLCVKTAEIKTGDEVITSPFSFIASSNCAVYEGAKPVFVDIDEKTFNIDANKIEQAITDKTKAIVAVHVFGHPCEIDKINEIAKKHNLKVIEDACEALGAEYKGKKIGTFGNPTVFSFYPNKQLTTGEGGIIVTDNSEHNEYFKSLSNQGRGPHLTEMVHKHIGYNYRLSDIGCALGVEQVKKADFILNQREKIAKLYSEKLKDVKGIKIPHEDENKKSWFVYVVRLDENIDRNKVVKFLEEKGIASKGCYFSSIHLQPIYKKMFGYKEGDFPVCEKVSASTLALPFFTEMTEEQVNEVCENLKKTVEFAK